MPCLSYPLKTGWIWNFVVCSALKFKLNYMEMSSIHHNLNVWATGNSFRLVKNACSIRENIFSGCRFTM